MFPPPTLFLIKNVRNFLKRFGNLCELQKKKRERKIVIVFKKEKIMPSKAAIMFKAFIEGD